jgi:non-specific serine/threonine protein kinase
MVPGASLEFGGLLKRFRLAAGLSQEALAERAGLSVAAVAALERGRRSHPRAFTVILLADALRLEPADRTALLEAAAAPPAGRASPEPPSPPPVLLTTFVGREPELAELRQRLDEVRLLTLTGAGGTGKTRLAAELVAGLTRKGLRQAWFVALDGCHQLDLVAPAVAAAVGISEAAGRSPVEKLAERLRDSDGLVVLDNCEHLLAAVAAVAHALLLACPRLRLLATSRAVLGLPGELTWRVPSLRLPPPDATAEPQLLAGVEAVRLFVERAALARPGFRLTDDNAAAVVGICRRLDGIPLAIELAAARARVLAPAQILARLEDASRLLTAGARTAAPRQQTLRATIEWSYRLLEPRERAVFDRLSVFSGGFDLEAAEAVAGGGGLDALASLVDQSLVVAEPVRAGMMRYRLLEVLRQFGRSCLAASGEADVVLGRHYEQYLEVARRADLELGRGERSGALRRLRLEHANFQAALVWARGQPGDLALRLATALGRYWELNGSITEGSAWLDEALATGAGEPALRAMALLRAGQLALVRTDYERAETYLAESQHLNQGLGDQASVARCMYAMADVAFARGDTGMGERLCEEALATMRRLHDRDGTAWGYMLLGWAGFLAGDTARAERALREAERLHRELNNAWGLAGDLAVLAVIRLTAGDVQGGRARVTQMMAGVIIGGVADMPGWVWLCLLLAAAEGRYRSVARLRGVIRTMADRGVRGPNWSRALSALSLPAVDAAYRELGTEEFERLADQGAALALDDVLKEAMAAPPLAGEGGRGERPGDGVIPPRAG